MAHLGGVSHGHFSRRLFLSLLQHLDRPFITFARSAHSPLQQWKQLHVIETFLKKKAVMIHICFYIAVTDCSKEALQTTLADDNCVECSGVWDLDWLLSELVHFARENIGFILAQQFED